MMVAGAWYTLTMPNGYTKKFQPSRWMQALEDPEFKNNILELIDIEVIQKFDKREEEAKSFYDKGEEE